MDSMIIRVWRTPIGHAAIDDSRYDGPGSLIGEGKTQLAAVADLLAQVDDQAVEEGGRVER